MFDQRPVGERRRVVSRGSGRGVFRAVGETAAVRCPIRPGALAPSDPVLEQARCQSKKVVREFRDVRRNPLRFGTLRNLIFSATVLDRGTP